MATQLEPLMKVSEVAAALHVGQTTVKRMIRRREIRAARVGKLWRIPSSEVDRLLRPVEIEAPRRSGTGAVAEVAYSTAEPPIRFETPTVEGRRIFKRRPWEHDDSDAPSSAAGRARSAGKRKAASVRS